jgi:hypothetical protein
MITGQRIGELLRLGNKRGVLEERLDVSSSTLSLKVEEMTTSGSRRVLNP